MTFENLLKHFIANFLPTSVKAVLFKHQVQRPAMVYVTKPSKSNRIN